LSELWDMQQLLPGWGAAMMGALGRFSKDLRLASVARTRSCPRIAVLYSYTNNFTCGPRRVKIVAVLSGPLAVVGLQ